MRRGDHVGSLRIERLLGVGGMGEVYLAFDVRLERRVAVKMLTNADARERMLREARAVSMLRHPGIATIYDIGEHRGRTFIAMEYVEGQTFSAMVKQRGPLPPGEAVARIAQVGDTLAAAHDAGILHRDIKSANLMVDAYDRVRVLDFGLCKRKQRNEATATSASIGSDPDLAPIAPDPAPTIHRTRWIWRSARRRGLRTSANPPDLERSRSESREAVTPAAQSPTAVSPPNAITAGAMPSESSRDEVQTQAGAQLGTPGWAPPELVDGRPAEVRSDVFSLGVVLYHLLTGRLPFPGRTWGQVRQELARGPVPPSVFAPSIPRALEAVILSALAIDLDQRPENVRELVARAQAAVVEHRRRRARWWLAAGSVAAGIGTLVAVTRTLPEASHAAPHAAPPEASHAAPPEASRDRAQGLAAAGAPSDFSPPAQLTALGGCAYSPAFVDRDTVTFDLTRDGAVDLYRIDVGAKAPVRLTSDPGWEWRSGPGRRSGEVAFIRQGAGTSAIEAIDLASGERTVLLTQSAVFALTSDTLYYAPGGKLRRRLGARDEVMLVLPDQTIDSITAARDGSRLAMVVNTYNGGPKVCIVATDAGQLVCPTVPAGSGRPAFSPDASVLYFDRSDGIGRLRLADAVPEVAVPGVNARGGIAVSPDGHAVVWSDCGVTSDLIDPSTDSPRFVLGDHQVRSVAIGPGDWVAYERHRAHTSQLIVRDPDGIARELVRRSGARVADIAFSPDGTSIAFVLLDSKDPGIYLTSTEEMGVPNRLTDDTSDHRPFFMGSELVFTRYDRDRVPHLMRIRTDGSSEQVASSRPRSTVGADWSRHRVLLASPDLAWLYWWDPVTGRESPGPKVNLGKRVQLRNAFDISLSSDGRWLLYLLGNNGQEIWRQRLDDASPPELLRRLPEDITALRGAIDPSGHAAVVTHHWSGDLWISRAVPR